MKHNVVAASAFTERGIPLGRLDAEFVDPDKLKVERRLVQQHSAKPLADLHPATIENYAKPKTGGGASKSYIAIDDIDARDGFVFHQTLVEHDLPSRAKYQLEKYDIVISNVRPERGAVGLVLEGQDGAIGSSGLTVLRVQDESTRNVLFAFLRTKWAREQLVRRSRGSMYPAVTKDDIPEVLVPTFPANVAEAASAKVVESVGHREKFFKLHALQAQEVDNFLQDELGDPPPDIVLDTVDQLPIRIARYSELGPSGADRFDAEFHRKEFVDFQEKLSANPNTIRLGTAFDAFAGGNPGKGSSTVLRLRQAQLTGFGIDFSGCEAVDDAKGPAKMTLREGDVLIGCTAHEPHYVGNRVDHIDVLPVGYSNNTVPVADVMIIRSLSDAGEVDPAFLASFLNTRWGRRQFQRLNRGLRGGHVYGDDVKNFIFVPKPSVEWMKGFQDRQSQIRIARRGSIQAMLDAVWKLEAALGS